MKKHLPLSLILIIIQRVIFGVRQLNQPIHPGDSQILLTPTKFQLSDFGFLRVVNGFLDLLDDGLGLVLGLMLEV